MTFAPQLEQKDIQFGEQCSIEKGRSEVER